MRRDPTRRGRAAWLCILAVCLTQLVAAQAWAKKQRKVRRGRPAPSIALRDTEGRWLFYRPKKLRAPGPVTVVAFFATWCQPCKAELPDLQRVLEAYEGRPVDVLLVGLKETAEQLTPVLTAHGWTGRTLVDRYGKVAEAWGVKKLPRIFVVDRRGILRHVYKAKDDALERSLRKRIDKLLRGG